jgi:hypothetical protein
MTMGKFAGWAAVVALCGFGVSSASADTVNVAGTSDIFLAGQTSVPNDPADFGSAGSSFPGSPAGTLPVAISVFGGEVLDITASGLVSFESGESNGPNGITGPGNFLGYGFVNGYSSATQFALLGVFNGSTAAFSLNPFQIGSTDDLVVPTGATELYLGFADAGNMFGKPGFFNDNSGSLTVDVLDPTPLPASWSMMLIGFAAVGFFALRKQKSLPGIA